MSPRTKVFISYSNKDRAWLERLQVHLKSLERDGLIERWDDTRIQTGERWRDEIKNAINSARVVVLLISADFLASDFIEKEELPPFLAAAQTQGAVILPVNIGYCLLEGPNSKVGQYQAINSPDAPLEALNEAERNRVWKELARKIYAIVKPDSDEAAATPAISTQPTSEASPVVESRPAAPVPSSLPVTASTPAATSPSDLIDEPGQGRYALLIINDKLADPVFAALVTPLDDTLGLEGVLTSKDVGGFKVTTLRNQTCEAISNRIETFFSERQPDDLTLFYYFGVGVKDSEWGLQFVAQDSQRDDPSSSMQVYNIQKAMQKSRSRRQLIIFDCAYVGAYTEQLPIAVCDRRNFLAKFQGEGRFVLSATQTLRQSWEKGTAPPAPVPGQSLAYGPAIANAIVHGLKSGRADQDHDQKVSVDELFGFVEATVSNGNPDLAPVRWAFDQSKSDLIIADVSLPGENQKPTPIVRRYSIAQDIRQPILELIVPTYILDHFFYLLDWNPAFDEIIARQLKLVRGQHAKAFVQALVNVEETVKHAKESFGGVRHPLVDSEVLVFHSETYGEIRFRKVAAQITNDEGNTMGWSVCLNVLDAGRGDGIWPEMLARMEDEVSWSRYAVVYDTLLLKFPEYNALIKQVTDLVAGKRRCIDLGAGTGNNALRLLDDPDREVWAVDINETMLRYFRAKLEPYPADYADRLTIVKDNILRLDALPRSSFDAAVMTNVLYAVRDRDACLRQVNRILKPGGILALSTPHNQTDVDALFARLAEALEDQDLMEHYQEHFDAARSRHDAMIDLIHRDSIDDIVKMLESAGFQIEGQPIPSYVGAVVVIKAVKARDLVDHPAVAAPRAADVIEALTGAPDPSASTKPDEKLSDVFLSYSAEDKPIADQILAYLEEQAIPCWISSRDITSSKDFAAEIVQAIHGSRVMVLVLSKMANRSIHTAREVAVAAKHGIPIIPFRSENVDPSEALAYYLSNVHWLDAFPPPVAQHLPRLGETIRALLSRIAGEAVQAEKVP